MAEQSSGNGGDSGGFNAAGVIGGASSLVGLLGPAMQKSSPISSAKGEASSAMYGNFSTGDFSTGGGGISTNFLILAVLGVVALLFYFSKRK